MARHLLKTICAALLSVAALTATGPAAAAPPVIEREQIDDSFADEFLTAECGVDVTTTVTGAIMTMTTEAGRLLEVRTINLGFTATAGDNIVRFRDVGGDFLLMQPDGTLVVTVVGQIPFDFTGALKFNPETGEVLLEPQHFRDVADVCAILVA
jgi:hypothetical protein